MKRSVCNTSILLVILHLGVCLKIQSKGHRHVGDLDDTMTLPCTIKGGGFNPFSNIIIWYKIEDGVEYQINTMTSINAPFEQTNRYTVNANMTADLVQMPLVLKNITLAENGSYKCELKDKNRVINSITHTVTVQAHLSSFIFVSNTTREDPDQSGLTFEFEELVPSYVACMARGGNPKPSLRMIRGKVDITNEFNLVDQEKQLGLPGLGVTDYDIQLVNPGFKATKSMRGETIKCVAKFHRFTALRSSKLAYIEVKYGPRFLCADKRMAFPDDSDYTLECLMSSNPPIDVNTVLWQVGTSGLNLTASQSTAMYSTNYTRNPYSGEVTVMLTIANITNSSFQTYTLHASNDVSHEAYPIILREAFTTVEPTTTEAPTTPEEPTIIEVQVQQSRNKPSITNGSTSPHHMTFTHILIGLASILIFQSQCKIL